MDRTFTSEQNMVIIDKAIKSVPKGISAKDAEILKETKEGKR